jgi:hypothetical protein
VWYEHKYENEVRFIEGKPALDNMNPILSRLYSESMKREHDRMEEARKKNSKGGNSPTTTEERIKREFAKKGL